MNKFRECRDCSILDKFDLDEFDTLSLYHRYFYQYNLPVWSYFEVDVSLGSLFSDIRDMEDFSDAMSELYGTLISTFPDFRPKFTKCGYKNAYQITFEGGIRIL